LGGISRLVNGKAFLPALGELAGDSSCELCVLFGVFFAVGSEKGIPFCLESGSSFAEVSVEVIGFLRDLECLVGCETEFGL
jgi:hypothetical protein